MSDFTYFIIVSGNDKIIKTFDNVIKKLSKDAIIIKFADGEDGLKGILKQKKPTVVILDKTLQVMNGLQLISKIKKTENVPRHHLIILNSYEDQKFNLEALKNGANDVLSEPFSVDKLIFKLRNAYRLVQAYNNENSLNEQVDKLSDQINNISDHSVDMLSVIQNEIYPKTEHIEQVHKSATWISKQLCSEEIDIINTAKASKIAYIGKVYLPEKFINNPVLIEGRVQNEKMERVPHFIKELIGEIDSLKEVYEILYHIYENFDGSGIPSKEKAWKIPIGARILRVCMDYHELYDKLGKNSQKVIDALLHESKRLYDHRIIAYYDQFLAVHSKYNESRKNEIVCPLNELSERMVLSRNIITDGGLKLMPVGQDLTEPKINKIKTIAATDPIIGNIYIQR